MAYITVEPTLIANETMKKWISDATGEFMNYRIYPNEGYVLHDTQYDQEGFDEETMEPTGEIILGYLPYPSFVTVGPNYDFATNLRQLYCVPADTVPENQIFNNGGPEHEVASTELNTETE